MCAASPYWRHNKPPSDLTVDDEEDVDIECQAHGRPRPNVTWSINGTLVSCQCPVILVSQALIYCHY